MRVIIVDDEMLERKAMRKFLEESFHDLNVIGEAENGRKAIELAKQLNPDFMLMDIKMPGIDGLEAIKSIRQINPNIKFIMVTAYDSFDYAKQAMKEGVKEYILKPAKKQETVEAINRICKELKEERENREKNINILKEHFLLKLTQSEGEESLQKELFPKMKSGFFSVIEGERPIQKEEIERLLKDLTEYSFVSLEQKGLLHVLCISQKEGNKAEILKAAKKIQIAYQEKLWIGIGFPYEDIHKLPKSYHEALEALQQLKMKREFGYGFPMKEEKAQRNIKEALMMVVNEGNYHTAWQYFSSLSNEEDKFDVFLKIHQLLEEKGVSYQGISYSEQLDWEEFLKVCCLKIQEVHHSHNPIERAKKYIKEHFTQPLTLEEVAENVGLSPNYFTKVFKDTTGVTFSDYVTNIRLLKAKELLEKNELSLKEICFMVGYKDPNYFSRVFKKQFNLSPKQYQKQILKK